MLRFTSLGSGSSGNATLVEAQATHGARATRVLVDCGFGPRRLAAALAQRGVAVGDLDAIFVTHEHSDHVGGVLALQRRYGTPVWASAGTWLRATARVTPSPACRIARNGEDIVVGSLRLQPFAVPHDAAEPLQLTLSDGRCRLGILTDIGEPTNDVVRSLQGCDALLLECNHDAGLLDASDYPQWLKRRIAGNRGHLANHQSAALLDACRHDGLRHVVAAHLSQRNNRPELAVSALQRALGAAATGSTVITVADAVSGCVWIDID